MKSCCGLLAAGLTLLTVASTTPETACAKGPRPKADFTISTNERLDYWDWGSVDGTWKMGGVVSDSGTLYGGYGGDHDHLWLDGEFGSMEIVAYREWDTGLPTSFEVVDGTGLYEGWIGAVGDWDLTNTRRSKEGWWKSGRKLKGFLP